VYASDSGASVINLSLGGPDQNSAVSTAIEYATSRGRTVVAASGNSGSSAKSYPAADPRVIAAGASTQSDTVASFSNYGEYLDVVAPGVGIMSTLPGSFGNESGTSMAAPYVSATAALLRSAAVARNLGTVDVAQALDLGAKDVDAAGRDVRSGAGRIDPRSSLCVIGACDGVPAVKPVPSQVPASIAQKQLDPSVSRDGRYLVVALNESGTREVVLRQKMTKKYAKKRFAKGKIRSNKRGPWRVAEVGATSPVGEVRFRLRKGYVYRVVLERTATSAKWTSGKVKIR
jgi:subtilisin family serine protease